MCPSQCEEDSSPLPPNFIESCNTNKEFSHTSSHCAIVTKHQHGYILLYNKGQRGKNETLGQLSSPLSDPGHSDVPGGRSYTTFAGTTDRFH